MYGISRNLTIESSSSAAWPSAFDDDGPPLSIILEEWAVLLPPL